MKRLLFFALTALVLASCATTTLFDAEGRQLSKSEQDRITASVVSQRLAQRKYRIFADYMYPQRLPASASTTTGAWRWDATPSDSSCPILARSIWPIRRKARA